MHVPSLGGQLGRCCRIAIVPGVLDRRLGAASSVSQEPLAGCTPALARLIYARALHASWDERRGKGPRGPPGTGAGQRLLPRGRDRPGRDGRGLQRSGRATEAPRRRQGAPTRARVPRGNSIALSARGGDRCPTVPPPHRPDPLRRRGTGRTGVLRDGLRGRRIARGELKRRGRLAPDEARRIMQETADALGAAHALGIIHRDVKPDNILLEGSRGRVVVTDFGIAKALSSTTGSATLTATGVAIGTPHYMSPEQAAGDREIDGRSDIYSLGVVAYQTLAGELPFSAPTVPGILMKHITEQAPRVVAKRPDCPPDLESCVMRCLEKDPEDRWPTADALRRSLEARTATAYQPRRPPAAGTRRYSGAPPLPAPPGPPAQRGRDRDRRPSRRGR